MDECFFLVLMETAKFPVGKRQQISLSQTDGNCCIKVDGLYMATFSVFANAFEEARVNPRKVLELILNY